MIQLPPHKQQRKQPLILGSGALERDYVGRAMRKTYYASVVLLISITMLLGACGQKEGVSTPPPPAIKVKDFQAYEHQGLKLSHPSHWTPKFDEAPDFSSDRAVVFDPSELSRVTLYIYQEPGESPATIADHYAKRLGLETNESINNYRRTPVTLDNYKGLRLSWQETGMFTRNVEVTILKVLDSPFDTFIVFDLDQEDVERETPNIIPVIQSITLQ